MVCRLIRPPDVVDLGFIAILLLSFFRQLPFESELTERNSTKTGRMFGSECDSKMHVQNLGYAFPYKWGALKPPIFDDLST